MKALLPVFLLTVGFICFEGCVKKITSPHVPSNYTLTLRPDSTTGQDSYVSKVLDDSADGGANLNWTHELIMARWTFEQFGYDSGTQRSYIRFDSLAKIPTTATVTSAILYLYGENPEASPSFPIGNSYYPGSNNPPNPVVIEAVIGGTWQQKTITWNNAPAASSAIQDSIGASTSQYNYNATIDVTNLVKPMVSSPSTNYGFMLKLITENIEREMQFATCEAADSTQRPMLVVQYTY
jgi:hypothetical protein